MRLWCETLPLCRLRFWDLTRTICLAAHSAHKFGIRKCGKAYVDIHGRGILDMPKVVDLLGLHPDEVIGPKRYLSGHIPTYL
jgi:hypothetical protein